MSNACNVASIFQPVNCEFADENQNCNCRKYYYARTIDEPNYTRQFRRQGSSRLTVLIYRRRQYRATRLFTEKFYFFPTKLSYFSYFSRFLFTINSNDIIFFSPQRYPSALITLTTITAVISISRHIGGRILFCRTHSARALGRIFITSYSGRARAGGGV